MNQRATSTDFFWPDGVHYYPCDSGQRGLIVSCGVHGDETGPINSVRRLHKELDQKRFAPSRPLLIIYANLKAIEKKTRFVRHNMNRLFNLAQNEATNFETEPEWQRAQLLERCCQHFFEHHGKGSLHLDLHSTIKPSRHLRFVLQPHVQHSYSFPWVNLLTQVEVSAWVHQHSSSHTFSQCTHDLFSMESLTLECGNIQQQQDDRLYQALKDLICDAVKASSDSSIQHYSVHQTIIKRSEQFRFLVDEQQANFSIINKGEKIFSDMDGEVEAPTKLYGLFFNSNVPIGHRAGILLIPSNKD